jgi:hypothetical protein
LLVYLAHRWSDRDFCADFHTLSLFPQR